MGGREATVSARLKARLKREHGRVVRETGVERRWHAEAETKDFRTGEELDLAERVGELVRLLPEGAPEVTVHVNPNSGARVWRCEFVERTCEENRVASGMAAVWGEILNSYLKKLAERRLDPREARLRITSMTRTTRKQEELIAGGYPAAKSSSHTKGWALDVYFEWLAQNRLGHAECLMEALREGRDAGRINFVVENQYLAGGWHRILHVAGNPLKFNRHAITGE